MRMFTKMEQIQYIDVKPPQNKNPVIWVQNPAAPPAPLVWLSILQQMSLYRFRVSGLSFILWAWFSGRRFLSTFVLHSKEKK